MQPLCQFSGRHQAWVSSVLIGGIVIRVFPLGIYHQASETAHQASENRLGLTPLGAMGMTL